MFGRLNVCLVVFAIFISIVHLTGRVALKTEPDIILGTVTHSGSRTI